MFKNDSVFSVLLGLALTLILVQCRTADEIEAEAVFDWTERFTEMPDSASNYFGETYLSVYPELYTQSKKTMLSFTSTISIRNISRTDTVYFSTGEYYSTKGDKIQDYFEAPIYVKPLETIEIIIHFEDDKGGSGANFLFNWAVKNKQAAPLIEGVMVSTLASQGMAFSTKGINHFTALPKTQKNTVLDSIPSISQP